MIESKAPFAEILTDHCLDLRESQAASLEPIVAQEDQMNPTSKILRLEGMHEIHNSFNWNETLSSNIDHSEEPFSKAQRSQIQELLKIIDVESLNILVSQPTTKQILHEEENSQNPVFKRRSTCMFSGVNTGRQTRWISIVKSVIRKLRRKRKTKGTHHESPLKGGPLQERNQ